MKNYILIVLRVLVKLKTKKYSHILWKLHIKDFHFLGT